MATSASVTHAAASKVFLVVAVALGILATVLAFGFINSAGGGAAGAETQIVIARRDLPVNVSLDPERDLDVRKIPGTFESLHQLTLDSRALANYKGQHINRNIPAGQPVFLADIGNAADYKPTRGLVALPIQAEPGIAIPGDYVKVLVARPDVGAAAAAAVDPSRTPYIATYAAKGQAFRVIAIGGNLFRTRSQVLAADASSSSSSSKLVTLEVTESQAQEIQSAIGGGFQRATLVIVAPPEGAEIKP